MKFLDDIPAICQRCQLRGYYAEMVEDVNIPGLYVHPHCADMIDPYRLAPRPTEDITLSRPRPDAPVSTSVDLSYLDIEYVVVESESFGGDFGDDFN